MTLHPLISVLLDKGLSVSLSKEGYLVDGFHKSGTVLLKEVENENHLLCLSRYEKEDIITCFDDLVFLNFYWYEVTKERNNNEYHPGEFWLNEYLRLNLVKVKTKTVIE
jgi:hypothetical protein